MPMCASRSGCDQPAVVEFGLAVVDIPKRPIRDSNPCRRRERQRNLAVTANTYTHALADVS